MQETVFIKVRVNFLSPLNCPGFIQWSINVGLGFDLWLYKIKFSAVIICVIIYFKFLINYIITRLIPSKILVITQHNTIVIICIISKGVIIINNRIMDLDITLSEHLTEDLRYAIWEISYGFTRHICFPTRFPFKFGLFWFMTIVYEAYYFITWISSSLDEFFYLILARGKIPSNGVKKVFWVI